MRHGTDNVRRNSTEATPTSCSRRSARVHGPLGKNRSQCLAQRLLDRRRPRAATQTAVLNIFSCFSILANLSCELMGDRVFPYWIPITGVGVALARYSISSSPRWVLVIGFALLACIPFELDHFRESEFAFSHYYCRVGLNRFDNCRGACGEYYIGENVVA